jgi:hypothetical protein
MEYFTDDFPYPKGLYQHYGLDMYRPDKIETSRGRVKFYKSMIPNLTQAVGVRKLFRMLHPDYYLRSDVVAYIANMGKQVGDKAHTVQFHLNVERLMERGFKSLKSRGNSHSVTIDDMGASNNPSVKKQ